MQPLNRPDLGEENVAVMRTVSASPGARALSANLLDRACVLALGFALQFDVLTANFGLPFQRVSDLLPFLLIPYFCLRTDFVAAALRRIVPIGLVLALLAASLVLKAASGAGDLYLTLVLMLYVVQALQLVRLFEARAVAELFCLGIVLGFLASLAVLVVSATGMPLVQYGLAVSTDGLTPEDILFMQDKLGGLWASGNETGHVFAGAGAAALYLTWAYRTKAVYALFCAGLIASFPMTNNRAGLIVPLLVLVWVMKRGVGAYHLLALLGGVAAFGLFVGVTGTYPLPAALLEALDRRFASDSNVGGNLGERIDSGLAALGMILRYPFGIGVLARQDELLALTGVPSPHNGIVSLALQSGVGIAAAFVAAAAAAVLAWWRGRPSLAGLAVLFVVPSMLFEELSVNQFVLFMVALIIAAWLWGYGDPAAASPQARDRTADLKPSGRGPRA